MEGDDELEGTVPENWVDESNKFIWWPPVMNAKKYLHERREPTDKWKKFPMIKIKEKGKLIN